MCILDLVSMKPRQDGKLKASLGYIANCSLNHTHIITQKGEKLKEQNNTYICLLY